MRIKASLAKGLLISLAFSLIPAVAISAQKVTPGSKCKVQKQKVVYLDRSYTCIKSGKKLVWNKGVVVVKPAPTPTPTPAPTAASSTVTNVSGYLNVASCKLVNANNENGVNQSFQQNPFRVRNTKPIRALIFPIDFPDLVGSSDPQKDFKYVADGVSDYFKQISEGKSVFEWTIHPKFIRYGSKVADAALGGRQTSGYPAFSAEAMKMAMQTVDTSEFDLIVYAPPLTTTREQIAVGPAFVSYSPSVINATMLDGQSYDLKTTLTIAHEIGHLMGLADLYNTNAANEAEGGKGGTSAFSLQFKYMGIFDLMNWVGGSGGELTAWNRWLTDLVTDDQIRCLPTPETTTLLTPVAVNGGIKGAVIPISTTEAIVMESRRALRYDTKLGKESEGVLVYKVNTSIRSGLGPMQVVGRSGSTKVWFEDAPLKLGETYLVDGYSIEVIESGVFGDVVRVRKN
jgi:M6 family metalloprotease-like protein